MSPLRAPHLPNAVRDSAHIDALTPIDFSYPLDPQGRAGVARFSAFGVIGGQLVRAQEQVIPQTDTAVFILATRGGNIQLVTSATILGEADRLAETLRRNRGVSVRADGQSGAKVDETQKAGAGNGTGNILNGGQLASNTKRRALRCGFGCPTERPSASTFTASRSRFPSRESKLVKIQLDASNQYAESIFVDVRGM